MQGRFQEITVAHLREQGACYYCWIRPGEVLDRYQVLQSAWDGDYENRSNVIDVYIRYLREKIDRPFGVESIETVRRSGYRLRADGGSSAPDA